MCAALTLPTKAVRRTYFEPKSGMDFHVTVECRFRDRVH